MSDPNAQPPVDPAAGGATPPVPPAGDGAFPPPPSAPMPPAAEPFPKSGQPDAPFGGAPQAPAPGGQYAPPPGGGFAQAPGGYSSAPGYAAPPAAAAMTQADEKLWATLIHIGGILFGFLAPLIGYLVLKDRGPFIKAHTMTALNFHLTMLIAIVVGSVLTIVLIGFIILPAVGIVMIIFGIMAAMKANSGELYTYPLSITFIKS